MNVMRSCSRVARLAALVGMPCFPLAAARAEVVIDMVVVGDPGNTADTNGYGTVVASYQIAKHDVTIGQYTEFLNAVAKTDPHGLYDARMASDKNVAGISQSGTSGSFTYAVTGPFGTNPAGASSSVNRPITYVSWYDAARFANWMTNGQGEGSTETGAYDLAGAMPGHAPAKTLGAAFSIPTENEWYKAAYYSPTLNSGAGGYYAYATQSNSAPGNTIGNGANQANYYYASTYAVTQSSTLDENQNYITDVGAFTGSSSFYGTFDQSGNVYQWNDLDGMPGMERGLRGGFWGEGQAGAISSSDSLTTVPSHASHTIGFRLVSPVPEPSTWVTLAAGIAGGGWHLVRRRRTL